MPSIAQRGARPQAPASKRCTKAGCGGELHADVDRNGVTVDSCRKCGTIYRPGIGATTGTALGARGRPCTVKKCPGVLNEVGVCLCCEKREAFLEQHLPKRYCAICNGPVRGAKKFCGACAPINTKVNAAKKAAKS